MIHLAGRGAALKAPHRLLSQQERSAGPTSGAMAHADARARARTDSTKGLGHDDTSKANSRQAKKPAVALTYAYA